MQKMVESVLINKLLDKYQSRLEECQNRWEEDFNAIRANDKEEIDPDVVDDMTLVNVQIGVYECIVKDLKELVG